MSKSPTLVEGKLWDYVVRHVRDTDVLRKLREETAAHPRAGMQISPDQGRFMQWLVQTMGARRCLEIGTFTGYSALCVALALPDDGRLVACDVSDEYTAVGRRYWAQAQVAHKIDLRIAPALDTLDALLAQGEENTFDFAFVDADKANYDGYYERCLKLVRPGGVIAFDNVLWDGDVAQPDSTRPGTRELQALNDKLYRDARVDVAMLTVADGLTLARKL